MRSAAPRSDCSWSTRRPRTTGPTMTRRRVLLCRRAPSRTRPLPPLHTLSSFLDFPLFCFRCCCSSLSRAPAAARSPAAEPRSGTRNNGPRSRERCSSREPPQRDHRCPVRKDARPMCHQLRETNAVFGTECGLPPPLRPRLFRLVPCTPTPIVQLKALLAHGVGRRPLLARCRFTFSSAARINLVAPSAFVPSQRVC